MILVSYFSWEMVSDKQHRGRVDTPVANPSKGFVFNFQLSLGLPPEDTSTPRPTKAYTDEAT